MTCIRLHNSQDRSVREFSCDPLDKKQISLYVCGITPYDCPHLGHGRCYVTFDLLYRVLTFFGYSVTYCRNFTDIDDKLMARSEKEFGTPYRYAEVAQRYIDIFHDDMRALNCVSPTHEPRVTQVIPEIIALIERLIKAEKAYVVDGDVYFSIDSYPDYGALSHRKLDDMQAGARVAVSDIKRNPLDFALWKSEAENTYFESPWGWGRPGWHIECSAMAQKYLGKTIDIHGGGMDLLFPHHENERAQSQSIQDEPFVHTWMHVAFVQVQKEKMSKSLGNFFTLRDLFKQFNPQAIRWYFLQHHYRSPLDFSPQDLERAQQAYKKIVRTFEPFAAQPINPQDPIMVQMLDFLREDLNTPGMLGVLYKHLDSICADAHLAGQVKQLLTEVLGLTLEPIAQEEITITPEMHDLLAQREQARLAKDWKRSDELRDQLKELGYHVQDKKLS